MATRNRKVEFPHLIIRASAGTGKTFQLSNRFIGLLHHDVPSDRILATTFTRKAAGEILDRVVVRLAEASLDDAKRRELGQFLEDEELTKPRCLELVQQLMRNLHRLRISTLDSFFAQIARSFSLELRLPPGWQIVDELEDARLRDEAIERVLRQNEVSDLLTLMHLLTKGEASRSVGQLMRATVKDLYALFQETDSAAWQRIPHQKPLTDADLAAALQDLQSVTVPDKSFEKARGNNYAAALAGDWDTFVSSGIAKKLLEGADTFSRKPIPAEVAAIYHRLLNQARAVLVNRVAFQTEATHQLLAKFDREYQQLKQQHGALRFDDVTRSLGGLRNAECGMRNEEDTAAAIESAIRNPQSAIQRGLTFRLDGRIDHLLLDEFQDTSPAQWKAVQPYAEQVTSEGGGSFFCVGDIKQAIYGWRGGVAEIFDEVGRELPGLTPQSLTKSYRSSPTIIETVNRVFRNALRHTNLDRAEPAARVWCEQFDEHSTARTDLPGYACLRTAPQPRDDQSREDAVLEFAADHIAQLVGQSPGRSVGVLVRKNETVARLIFELRRRQIHASEEGGHPLTDSAAVQLVLSLLRLADHPGDKVARFHVAQSPLGTAHEFTNHDDDRAAEQLARRIRARLATDGYGATLYECVQRLASHCNRRDLNRLMQLVELAYDYQPQATLRSDDFVTLVEYQKVADPSSADVRVMTVHQAKGLEFDIVVLPELDVGLIGQTATFVVHRDGPTQPVDCVCRYANSEIQQLLPARIQAMFATATDRDVTESLCVLYVALTRAVHALHMLIPASISNERTLPRTFAGLLRVALKDDQPVPPSSILFEQGDPDWFQHLSALPPTKTRATPAPFTEVKLASTQDARRRGLDRVSPSSLEGGSRVKIADILGRDNVAALSRGTLFHKWFELIEWLDEGRPTTAALRQAANEVLDTPMSDADLTQRIDEFHTLLDSPAVAKVLHRASYERPQDLGLPPHVLAELSAKPLHLKVHNEHGFATRDADRIVTGSIDRLVLIYAGDKLVAAEILDYKTDNITPDDMDLLFRRTEHYRPQLAAYRAAMARHLNLPSEQIAARLLFLAAKCVRTI